MRRTLSSLPYLPELISFVDESLVSSASADSYVHFDGASVQESLPGSTNKACFLCFMGMLRLGMGNLTEIRVLMEMRIIIMYLFFR